MRLCALALILPALLLRCGSDSSQGKTDATAAPTTDRNTLEGSVATDREALVALYNATDGPNWRNNTNWLSDAPMGEWHGVTTDDNGRVAHLSLDFNS